MNYELNYEQIKSQLQSFKPNWEKNKTQLEALTIPEDLFFKEFLTLLATSYLKDMSLGNNSDDPDLKLTSLEQLHKLNADYLPHQTRRLSEKLG